MAIASSFLTSVFCLLPFALTGTAQQPRDAVRALELGPGLITGTVREDGTSRPLRQVIVSLSGEPLRDGRTAVTDEAGRFTFPSLPLGPYTISAQRPGYLLTFYGSRRLGRGPGEPIALSPEAPRADIAVSLPKGGVISGVITDANGRPAQNVRLVLMQYRMVQGERQLMPVGGPGGATDDRGVYRLFGLLPGDYLLSAIPTTPADVPTVSRAQVEWALRQVQPAGPGANGDAPPPSRVAYTSIYYPGTSDPAGAATITVRGGEERAGVDFILAPVPMARIEGVVIDSAGRGSAQASIRLVQAGQQTSWSSVNTERSFDGRFVLNPVPPGQWTLTANAPGSGGVNPVPATWGTTEVAVSGSDVSGLVVALRPALTMTGRVIFETTPPEPPPAWSSTFVTLSSVPGSGAFPPTNIPSARLDAIGTFTLPGILPGRYRLSLSGPGLTAGTSRLVPKSILLSGVDAADRPFTIGASDTLDRVVITYTDGIAELSGRLLDPAGAPAKGLTVVLFTADRSYWGLQSRRTADTRPDPSGLFRFGALLPGDYFVCAVTDFDVADTADPTFYDALVPASVKVTLASGQRKVQDLRLAARTP